MSDMRRQSIEQEFVLNNGRMPETKLEKHLMDFLVGLNEFYDEECDKMRALNLELIRLDAYDKKTPNKKEIVPIKHERDILNKRCDWLDKAGHYLRQVVNVDIKRRYVHA